MHINNNSSPSFGALHIKNESIQTLMSDLKPKVMHNFNKRAASLSKFSDKHGVDILFIKHTPDSIQTASSTIQKTIEYVADAVRDVANNITGKLIDASNAKTNEATKIVANKLTEAADDATKTSAKSLASDVAFEATQKFSYDADEFRAFAAREAIEAAQDKILNDAAGPDIKTFAIEIKAKEGDDSIVKTIDDIEMPTVKRAFGNIFRRKSKKPSMGLLFSEIKKNVKEVEELNKIKNNFGI